MALPPAGRLAGLDLGSKTVGIALSDAGRSIATPHVTLKRGKFGDLAADIEKLVTEQDIAGFVLGLPINMNGTEGPRCQATRAFARNLSGAIPRPILLWDERLSTQGVTRTLLDADMSRKRRAAVVDKMAAAFILQGALDAIRRAQAEARS